MHTSIFIGTASFQRDSELQIRYEEAHVTSVAFNQDHEETLAYSGQQMLSVRTGSHKPSRQRLNSLVVAFHGTTVYCLQNQQLEQQEVALGGTVEQLMEAGKWAEAFTLACLGVPMEVWDALAHGSLLALDLDVARRAFFRTQDFLMLNLVHRLTIMRQAAVQDSILVGEVLAHQVHSVLSPSSVDVFDGITSGRWSRIYLMVSLRPFQKVYMAVQCQQCCRESTRMQRICLQKQRLQTGSWNCGQTFDSLRRPRNGHK